MNDIFYPRFAVNRLKDALADTPVVLIHGPRQSGKTTLAQVIGEELQYSYSSIAQRTIWFKTAEFDHI
jgi:uncharacterized protein